MTIPLQASSLVQKSSEKIYHSKPSKIFWILLLVLACLGLVLWKGPFTGLGF
jgi:hypothetical protein